MAKELCYTGYKVRGTRRWMRGCEKTCLFSNTPDMIDIITIYLKLKC